MALVPLLFAGCGIPALTTKTAKRKLPPSYTVSSDTANIASINWREFFSDPFLIALIDTALQHNQELNIVMEEITIARSEVRTRKGEYLPFVTIGAGAGLEKAGRYTRTGAVDENVEMEPGVSIPEPLTDLVLSANVSWEADIWRKLRNARKAAMYRYLSSTEGRNFMVTRLVSEIAASYYELLALDRQLDILKQNIEIQQEALQIVKLQKEAARVTELAVRKFEAEVLKNQSSQYYIRQQITEVENRINFLLGRFPQPVQRNMQQFDTVSVDSFSTGIPSQLLLNRPDILQAELELQAGNLDVRVARANFYPSLRITAGAGYQAFNAAYLFQSPESILFSMAGELVTPLLNRNALKAQYYAAHARQAQTVHKYERTILNAYIEVSNQLARITNLDQSYDLKAQQVEALTEAIGISNSLFRSARADYMEVLMTQRDALESRFDLVEIRMQQLQARIDIYRSLGGGWK